jgi:hypothetical protein
MSKYAPSLGAQEQGQGDASRPFTLVLKIDGKWGKLKRQRASGVEP